jgi:lysophospholipase L1-like esterase
MDKYTVIVNQPIKLVGNDKIRIRGRHTEEDGMLAFDWSGSGFAFNFVGTGFIISLGGYSNDCPAYVKITVDGNHSQRFAVVNGSEKLIIEGLSDKRHRVNVLKITEGEPKLKFDTVTLLGNGAELRNPPFNSPRRIEFIGDSITCGYGVLGLHTDSTYRTYQQDVTRSYAGITAERFGADARFIAISGKGIVCNCNGDRTDIKTGEYYNRQSRTGGICNDGWVADVVVINIGTNDCGGPAPNDEFEQAARDLVAKVRDRYPEAHIIWLYGMMSQLYSEVLRDTLRDISKKDEKVHFMFTDTMYGNEPETGANGHPNVRCSVRVSNMLYKKIRSLTGWRNKVTLPEEE